jgi:2-succinyl-5-enolpyruvyl-6-hydroxy-3-cyclohexene-1-carboxylate synthase
VQLNCQFPEPLLPGPGEGDGSDGRPDGAPWTRLPERPRPAPVELPAGPRTVVVAGADAGPPARLLAERAGWPLLAEPPSGARTGGSALRSYRLLLGHVPLVAGIERVVVFGHPTLSRAVTRLLSRPDVEIVVCAPRLPWPDVGHRAAAVHPALTAAATADAGWSAQWVELDVAVSAAVDAALDTARSELPGGRLLAHDVARAVAAALPPAGLLVVGSSQPVRDLDLVAAPTPVGERRLVLANRGLSGIDGTVSTAIGAALARPSPRALAYVGDLTFLHDQGALLAGPGEPRPDLTVVVANDDGGSIFAVLEQGAAAYADAFERVFATPTGVDLGALCAATRTPHRRVGAPDELARALASPAGGVEVVEAVVDRAGRRALEQRLADAAAATLRERLPG